MNDNQQVSKIHVSPVNPAALSSVLSRDGPPDQLYLNTKHTQVNITEYQNKVWVYDFRWVIIKISVKQILKLELEFLNLFI